MLSINEEEIEVLPVTEEVKEIFMFLADFCDCTYYKDINGRLRFKYMSIYGLRNAEVHAKGFYSEHFMDIHVYLLTEGATFYFNRESRREIKIPPFNSLSELKLKLAVEGR